MTSLIPKESLDQVTFVHDYVQLFFDREVFNLYGTLRLCTEVEQVGRDHAGFCDRLVALIGEAPTQVQVEDDGGLAIQFSAATLVVLPDVGPESWEILDL